jgi:hypothetical protein
VSHVLKTRLEGAGRDIVGRKTARAVHKCVMQTLRVRGIDDSRGLGLLGGHNTVRWILSKG